MQYVRKAQRIIPGALITAAIATLAACGGGGTSSGGGGSAVASISGTVNGTAAAALESRPHAGPAYMLATLGDLVVSSAHAAGVAGVLVGVDCGNGASYNGSTDAEGRYRVLVPDVGSGRCATTFNGLAGPVVDVFPGSENEVDVTFDGSSINVVSIEQKFDNTPRLDIRVDDGISDDDSSDDVASNDDDSSSDGLSGDAFSDDDSSSDVRAEHDDDDSSEETRNI